MSSVISKDLSLAISYLKDNKIIVFPTDTLYGILANALCEDCVEKVYKIKKRTPTKPYLILIKNLEDLKHFDVSISNIEKKVLLNKGITVILNLKNPSKWEYLHRGTNSLAFRIPKNGLISKLLENLNFPVIAPSANPESLKPASNINEAYEYFKDSVDLYFDFGKIKNKKPSTIVKFENNKPIIVREGTISYKQILEIIQNPSFQFRKRQK